MSKRVGLGQFGYLGTGYLGAGYLRAGCLVVAVVALVACGGPPSQDPVSLVDLFPQATVTSELANGETQPADRQSTRWEFSGTSAASDSWNAAMGVAGLQVEDAALRGSASDDFPLIYAAIEGPPGGDTLHQIHLRLMSDRAVELSARVMDEPPSGPRGPIEGVFPWPFQASVEAGDDWQDVVMTATTEVPVDGEAFLVLRLADSAGDFALQSAGITYRRASLLAAEPTVTWQGVQHIYKEAIVARVGDTIAYDLTLPKDAWLDLALSQLGAASARFAVTIESDGKNEGEAEEVLTQTPEVGDTWEPTSVDLSQWSGRDVRLSLSLEAAGEGSPVGLWGAPVVRSRTPEIAGPRGVIVVVTDTLRRDHLGIYGYERDPAPGLTALAEQGAVAMDPISQSSWTKLAVTSLFTSMYPSSHTVTNFHDRLPAAAQTMAEIYRDAGYATLALSSIPFTGRFTNLHQGYETMYESSSLQNTKAKTARIQVERLLSWLEPRHKSPFFAFLHVADPHSPYEPYEPYDDLYGADGDVEEYLRQQNAVRPFIEHSPLMRVFGMPRRDEIQAAGLDPDAYVGYELDAYDGSIRGMDDELQKLIANLEEWGLRDEVIVAFVSDHGTEFLDHDAHFHGHTVYGELNQVPLIMWGPGFIPEGVRLEGPTQTIDMMPTMLELSGLPLPQQTQGRSLVPEIRGERTLRTQPAFTEVFAEDVRSEEEDQYNWSALSTTEWKLIVKQRPDGEVVSTELYDRTADPLDQNNVAGENEDVVASLTADLDAWRAETERRRLPSDAEFGQSLSDAEAESLRSLGYLQ